MSDEIVFIRKNGMFYGHHSCGYVERPELAEIYTLEEAQKHCSRCDELSITSPAVYGMTVKGIQDIIDRLEKMQASLTQSE